MLNASRGLSGWAELVIVGPTGSSSFAPDGCRVYETPSGLALFLLGSSWQSLRAIISGRFDIIIGGSGLVAPVIIILRLLNGGKTAVFLHGLDLVVKSRIYQAMFVPSISRVDLCIANSRNTSRIAASKGVSQGKLSVVCPGTALPNRSEIESSEFFCNRFDIPFGKILLFVGRITKRKGLSKFIENCLPEILKAFPEAGLVVCGDDPSQGLTSFGERDKVMETVTRLKLNRWVRFLGQLTDSDLRACYASADVQIFPLVEMPGDIEGFGMVAVEAAACGTPTVAFDLGGVADAVGKGNGLLVPAGNYSAFCQAVERILQTGHPTPQSCADHALKFGWTNFHKRIKALLDDFLKKTNSI